MSRPFPRVATPVLISAVVALFASAGLAVAAATIGTAQLKDRAVTTAKVRNGAVTALKLRTDAVTTAKLAPSAVTTPKLRDGAVTTAKLAGGAVTAASLAAGAVGSDQLLDGSIGSVDVADGAVAAVDIADGAIGSGKVADGSLTQADLAPGTAVSGKGYVFGGREDIATGTAPIVETLPGIAEFQINCANGQIGVFFTNKSVGTLSMDLMQTYTETGAAAGVLATIQNLSGVSVGVGGGLGFSLNGSNTLKRLEIMLSTHGAAPVRTVLLHVNGRIGTANSCLAVWNGTVAED